MFEETGNVDKSAVEILLGRAIDYAGLFPPAILDMESAVRKYHEHNQGPQSWMLGRFVVPVAQLEDFNFAALDILEVHGVESPWRLVALAGADLRADVGKIVHFNEWHQEKHESGLAVIDVVETKAQTPRIVETAVRIVPDGVSPYFEIPIDEDPTGMIQAVSRVGAGAKVRTGGVTPEMFPTAQELARFVKACHNKDVLIKATAGLHHPLCGVRNLTYEPGSPTGRMYGFLNLFVAAACARELLDDDVIVEVLREESGGAFAFDDIGVRWNGHFFSNELLEAVRNRSISAFGSCSIDEPIEDLKGLLLL